jgi:sugar phosphate isomerase/epimerase
MLLGANCAVAQPITNPFFVLHNGIRGDSVYKTFGQQVALVKSLGYAGIEINQIESLPGMKAALDSVQLPGAYYYVRLTVGAPLDARLPTYLGQLRGSNTIIAPYLIGDRTKTPDSVVVRQLRELADLARTHNLDVALYPHVGFWLERTDHAQRLVRQVGRPNVGLAFNLCHFLATTTAAERTAWSAHLRALGPDLKLVTICGADDADVPTEARQQGLLWDTYLKPLGTGTFDTFGLVKYLTRDLRYQGSIGLQCYALKGNKPTNLRQAMAVWQGYLRRLNRK